MKGSGKPIFIYSQITFPVTDQNNTMKRALKRKLHKLNEHFQDILKTKKHPHSVALGTAVGCFIGILPTPGFNILIAVLVVMIFSKVNKYAVFLALAIMNPLVTLPFYVASYKIGDAILANIQPMTIPVQFFNDVYVYSARFLLGSFILASLFSLISYMVTKKLVTKHYLKQGMDLKQIKQLFMHS